MWSSYFGWSNKCTRFADWEGVLNNISEIDNKLTTIAVAHRPAAIMNYDRIIHVHKGIIIGDGKFDVLIKENKIFKEMYEKNI